jgi:hypothetical protein
MPGLHFYSGGLLRMAHESADRAEKLAATTKDGLVDETLVTVVLAASAAEGFINDMVGFIRFLADIPGLKADAAIMRLAEIANALDSLEEDKAQIRSKYLIAALLLRCNQISAGSEPLQSYSKVVALRNSIVHAKPVSPDDDDKIVKLVTSLAQSGLCRNIQKIPNSMNSETWWVVMRTPSVAWWAVQSANALMLALVQSMVAIGDSEGLISKFRDSLQSSLVDARKRSGRLQP